MISLKTLKCFLTAAEIKCPAASLLHWPLKKSIKALSSVQLLFTLEDHFSSVLFFFFPHFIDKTAKSTDWSFGAFVLFWVFFCSLPFQGKPVLVLAGKTLRKCIEAFPAAAQRGADSCMADILGACSMPAIIIGWCEGVCGAWDG